jgi:hypothetical protein
MQRLLTFCSTDIGLSLARMIIASLQGLDKPFKKETAELGFADRNTGQVL